MRVPDGKHVTHFARRQSSSASTAVGWRLLALEHAVVAYHCGNAQPVIGENAGTAARLREAVRFQAAPALDRILIPPERERQDLAVIREAGETLDRYEAVDFLELGPQIRGGPGRSPFCLPGGTRLESRLTWGFMSGFSGTSYLFLRLRRRFGFFFFGASPTALFPSSASSGFSGIDFSGSSSRRLPLSSTCSLFCAAMSARNWSGR